MFEWLKSKSAKDEDFFRSCGEIAYSSLATQLVFVPKESRRLVDFQGMANKKALGYVFGFLDAVLQAGGRDIRALDGQACFMTLLSRLFPTETASVGTLLMFLKNNMAEDGDILNGVMLGGKQAVDFFNYKATPTRWATCFSKDMERIAEETDRKLRS